MAAARLCKGNRAALRWYVLPHYPLVVGNALVYRVTAAREVCLADLHEDEVEMEAAGHASRLLRVAFDAGRRARAPRHPRPPPAPAEQEEPAEQDDGGGCGGDGSDGDEGEPDYVREWREAWEAGEEHRHGHPAPPPPAPPAPPPVERKGRHSKYPRLLHPAHPGHEIRLVENDALGVYDMRAFCGDHDTCTWNQVSKKKPLAVLWAWLAASSQHATKRSHKEYVPNAVEIAAARVVVDGLAEARPWLEAERRHGA